MKLKFPVCSSLLKMRILYSALRRSRCHSVSSALFLEAALSHLVAGAVLLFFVQSTVFFSDAHGAQVSSLQTKDDGKTLRLGSSVSSKSKSVSRQSQVASTFLKYQAIQDYESNARRFNTFDDGTPYVAAGVPYKMYISDYGLIVIHMSELTTPAAMKNTLVKFMAKTSPASPAPIYGTQPGFVGAIPQFLLPSGDVGGYCSAGDSKICHFPVMDGQIFVPLIEAKYYDLTGDSSQFDMDSKKIDTALSILPLDENTGLPNSVKYVPGTSGYAGSEFTCWAFMEEVRFTGNVTHCAAWMFKAFSEAARMYGVVGQVDLQKKWERAAQKIAANMTTSSPLWNSDAGMYYADTGQNSRVIDVVGSALACSSNAHLPQLASDEQCMAIGTFIANHYSSIAYQGFVKQLVGNPPYTGSINSDGSYDVNGAMGCYQLGYWSMANYEIGLAINRYSPIIARQFIADFASGSNPQMEYWGAPPCIGNGNVQNLESPVGDASLAQEHPELVNMGPPHTHSKHLLPSSSPRRSGHFLGQTVHK